VTAASNVLEVRAQCADVVKRQCTARLDALVSEGTLAGWVEDGRKVTVEYSAGGRDVVSRGSLTAGVGHDWGLSWLDDFAPVGFVPELDPTGLPLEVVEWLEGLVHAPKRAWAEGYCRAVLSGQPEPTFTPGGFEEKAKRRADRMFFSGEGDLTGCMA
jgi:hypothetical protein